MNAANVPFRLLILNDSQQEAQRLTSMFQHAGKPCRAQHITSLEAFNKILEEQSWELVIAHSESKSPSPTDAIRSIRKYNQDLPVIILADDEEERSVVNGMKQGAVDVVELDDDQHLLLVVNRELSNREFRKHTRIAERKVKELERHNQQLLNSSKDGIAFIQDGTFIFANDSFAENGGHNHRDDIEYSPIMDMINEKDQDTVKHALKAFSLQTKDNHDNHLKFHIKTAEGDYKPIEVSLMMGQFDEETCIQFFINAHVDNNELLEAEIESIKYTDAATGLNNKLSFNQHLSECIDKAACDGAVYSLIYLDLDKFKAKVESVVGLDGADSVLSTVANFLLNHCDPDDFISRVADDAFAIVSEEHNVDKIISLGDKICQSVRDTFFEANSKTIRLTSSIGVTLINETTIDSQSAINQAIGAIEVLRQSNQNEKGDGTHFYQSEDNDQTILVSSLQNAIKENRFKLLFQPIISLRGDETERYEVLLRMLDEENNEISPTHFLRTAESMQANNKIDRWVLLEAIKHLSNHNEKAGNVQLMVHVSHFTLCDESLISWLKVAFKAANVNPNSLMLQASESDINTHLSAAKKFIEEAASLGVNFCINRFGCALDQMALLDYVDVEQIKIDNSFSIELQENPEQTEAIESLLNELKDRKKIITIPMVENPSILSNLWRLGVHCIQGNYLQPPNEAMDYEFAVEDSA